MGIAARSLVDTPGGPRKAADLVAGDLLSIQGGGVSRVLWCAHSRLTWAEQMGSALKRPLRIARGALGPDVPMRAVLVSPLQSVLCRNGPRSRLGAAELLVPALALTALSGVRPMPALPGLDYVHLLLERPDVIRVEGAAMGSLSPQEVATAPLSQSQRAALAQELSAHGLTDSQPAYASLSLRKGERLVDRAQQASRPLQPGDTGAITKRSDSA